MKKILLINGPAGSGKSFILNEILRKFSNSQLINRYTTREARADLAYRDEDVVPNQTEEQMKECDIREEFAGVAYGFKIAEINEALEKSKIPVILSGLSSKTIKKLYPFAYNISIRPNPDKYYEKLKKQGREFEKEHPDRYKFTNYKKFLKLNKEEYDFIIMNNYDEESKNEILDKIDYYLKQNNYVIFEDESEKKMNIELTSICNKRCKFCINEENMRNPCINKFLTMEQLHEAISIAKEKGYNTVMFTGGEPTLHPQFMEVMKTTYESGLAVKVITNYTRPEVLKKAEEYIDRIHISYYKQKKLPKFGEFKHADLYMLCMVSKTNFPTLRTFDDFIKKHTKDKPYKVYIDMIRDVNDFTKTDVVDFIDVINAHNVKGFTHRGEIVSEYKGVKIHRSDMHRDFQRRNISLKYLIDGTVSYDFRGTARDTDPVRSISSLMLTLRYEHNPETRKNTFKSLDSASL